jgi:hypothetical protein
MNMGRCVVMNMSCVVKMYIKNRNVAVGVIMILLLTGFCNAITASEYKNFLTSEINKYLDGEEILLDLDELRVAFDYYIENPNEDVDIEGIGFSPDFQSAINSSIGSDSNGNKYHATVNGEGLVCEGDTDVHDWYRLKGRCGEQSALDYWNDEIARLGYLPAYNNFKKSYDDGCYHTYGTGGDICNDKLLCKPGDDYEANTVWCTSKNSVVDENLDSESEMAPEVIESEMAPEVIAMSSKDCFDGDVYWFDSNGERGVKAEECGSTNTSTLRNVCYRGYCGTCRYDGGRTCSKDRDGYKINPSCSDSPRYAWIEFNGGGLYGSGGTWGYYNILNAVSVPVFEIGTTEYIVDGRLQWRGDSKGSGWYEVCETEVVVE